MNNCFGLWPNKPKLPSPQVFGFWLPRFYFLWSWNMGTCLKLLTTIQLYALLLYSIGFILWSVSSHYECTRVQDKALCLQSWLKEREQSEKRTGEELTGTWTPRLVNCWTLIHRNWRRLLMNPEVPSNTGTAEMRVAWWDGDRKLRSPSSACWPIKTFFSNIPAPPPCRNLSSV